MILNQDLSRFGDAPALLFGGRPAIGYDELERRVEQLARRLPRTKTLVAVEAAPSEHAIIAYLAALRRRHVVALLPPRDERSATAFIDRFSPELVYRPVAGRWRLAEGSGRRAGALHPDLALLLETSGSTGAGKVVRISSDALASNAAAIAEFLELTGNDRAGLMLPLHYSYGLSVLNSHLAVGASVYFPSGSILDRGFVGELIAAGCTNLPCVPFSIELLEQIGFSAECLPALRFMTVAGGRLPPDLAARCHRMLATAGKQLYLMYGQTEATARIAYVPPDRTARYLDHIGVAVPGGELALLDENGEFIATSDTAGELVYRGPNTMMGYAERREDLARGREVGWLRTGDLATRDPEGYYRITGRLRRMSKIAGIRIGHDAVEAGLRAQGIAAAVVGDDKTIFAAYTADQDEDSVREALAGLTALPVQSLQVRRTEALPRLTSGKLDYEAVRSSFAASCAATSRDIAEAFRHAFFPTPVDERDSFVSLGGDSLRHVLLSMEIERRLGAVPPDWQKLTVSELGRMARSCRGRLSSIDIEHLIRALAILFVVVQHATLWPVPVGSASLVVLVGYGLARFQSEALIAGRLRPLVRPLMLVLVPYYLILLGFAIGWGEIPWASVLLIANFGYGNPADHTMLPYLYWFVEAFVQMTLVFAVLFGMPWVRRRAMRDGFRFGLVLLAAALALRLVGPTLWPIGGRQIFTLPWVFYLAVFGWCVVFANTDGRRVLLLGLAAVTMSAMAYLGGNWIGSWVRYEAQVLVIAALLFMPRLRLPQRMVAMILLLAAASFHIYLVHRLVPEYFLEDLEPARSPALAAMLAIASGVGLGLMTFRLQNIGLQWLREWRTTAVTAYARLPEKDPTMI